jgi:hypothetical protein
VLLAMLALIPAIAMLELLFPAFRVLLRFSLQTGAGWSEYALLTLIAGIVGLACGAYPALVLSATRPQAVLRAGAQQRVKGGLRLRTLLVAVQFCFASMLLIGTAALYLQLAVTRAQPRFRRHQYRVSFPERPECFDDGVPHGIGKSPRRSTGHSRIQSSQCKYATHVQHADPGSQQYRPR